MHSGQTTKPAEVPSSGPAAMLLAPLRGIVLASLAVAELVVALLVGLAVLLFTLGVGVFCFPLCVRMLRSLADRARVRAVRWGGVPIERPYRPMPELRPGWSGRIQRCGAALSDPAFWRDLLWATLDPLIGFALAVIPMSLVVYGVFGALVQPFLWQLITDAGGNNWYAMVHVTDTGTALLAVPVGVVITLLGVVVGPGVLRVHARWTHVLLAPTRNAELVSRVGQLSDSRADATNIQAAELRRIERDLHDGAQARLVAMGMSLGHADELLERDPATARVLLAEVRNASNQALNELRDLVRGIHPPVLADRGLTDAVRALAFDHPIDVEVQARLAARPPAPIESAAYFAVSEVLTNAVKHAGCDRMWVEMDHSAGALRITVTDNGRGGADLAGGTGMRGIARRLATFDGTFAVDSPRGGPTVVTMEIPCELSWQKTSFSSEMDSSGR